MNKQEVMRLVGSVVPRLGCDYTRDPIFPEGRDDVCVVLHTAENGRDYGYDVAYLVWEESGTIRHREIANTRSTKDYLHIKSVSVDELGRVSVDMGSGGSFTGVPWSDTKQFSMAGSELQSEQSTESFSEYATRAMKAWVETHQPTNPLYERTRVEESVVGENHGKAFWIGFEQIDADHSTPGASGWLGDQFRYSIWALDRGGNPRLVYEDHAYLRARKSALTGTRGRLCVIRGLRVEGKGIAALHAISKDADDNPQQWETLRFPME